MKKHFFYLTAAVAVLMATFTACDKAGLNEDGFLKETTTEEDKANIQASFDRVQTLIRNFRNGNFYHFAEDFFGVGPIETHHYSYVGEGSGDYISGYYNYTPGTGYYERSGTECFYPEYDGYCYNHVGYGGNYSWVHEYKYVGPGQGNFRQGDSYTEYSALIPEFTVLLGEEFGRMVDWEQIGRQNRFNMAIFAGQYTWNNSTKKWNKTAANNIQAVFPSTENGQANCEAAITAYTDKPCIIEGTTIYLPTKISSYFNKDGIRIASVDATGDFNAYGIPKNATANVYAKPITLQASLNQTSASKFTASLAITDETSNENSLTVSGEAILSNAVSNYTDLDDCALNHLKFTLVQHLLSINGTIDVKTLNNISRPSVADINTCLNLEVWYNNKKTGTLKVREVGGDKYLYIIYKDGTEENTAVYYDSFLTDIEHLFLNK